MFGVFSFGVPGASWTALARQEADVEVEQELGSVKVFLSVQAPRFQANHPDHAAAREGVQLGTKCHKVRHQPMLLLRISAGRQSSGVKGILGVHCIASHLLELRAGYHFFGLEFLDHLQPARLIPLAILVCYLRKFAERSLTETDGCGRSQMYRNLPEVFVNDRIRLIPRRSTCRPAMASILQGTLLMLLECSQTGNVEDFSDLLTLA